MELVDTLGLEPSAEKRGGSNPSSGTILLRLLMWIDKDIFLKEVGLSASTNNLVIRYHGDFEIFYDKGVRSKLGDLKVLYSDRKMSVKVNAVTELLFVMRDKGLARQRVPNAVKFIVDG